MARKKSTTKQVVPARSSAPADAAIGAAAIASGSGAEPTAGPPGASEGAGAEAPARPRSAFASGAGAEPTAGPTSSKAELVAELIAQLGDALAAAQRAHAAAIEGATHTEARAENPKDTRGLEQSYLARGQAQRVAELEAGLAAVSALAVRSFGASDPIALGALVTVEDLAESTPAGGATQRLLFAPHGGGNVLAGGVQVVTASSPLGRALIGKRVDDEVELRLPGRLRTLLVIAIA